MHTKVRHHVSSVALVVFATATSACGKNHSLWQRDSRDDDGKEVVATDQTANPSREESGKSRGIPVTTSSSENDSIAGTMPSLGPILNLDSLRDQLGLRSWQARGHRGSGVRIAILDNGFAGLEESLGKRLPPGLSVPKAPGNPESPTTHGTMLAELVHALATGDTSWDPARPGPELLLLNSNGFTNFSAAVDQAIAARVDMILYSQVWEYGGNFDGRGFINSEVDRATAAGITWVNAAGNFGLSSFSGPVVVGAGHGVILPHEGRYVRFRVPAASGNRRLPVKIVLAWNDFATVRSYRTPQDLDLVLESSAGVETAAGRLIQDGSANGGDARFSAHAREIIRAELAPGIWHLRVDAISRNFDPDSMFRISIDGAGVEVLDAPASETILIPADNPKVLTVGAADANFSAASPAGASSGGTIGKPEILAPSRLRFAASTSSVDVTEIKGSSSAAAVAVATLAVWQSGTGRVFNRNEAGIRERGRENILRDVQLGLIANPDGPRAGAAQMTVPELELSHPSLVIGAPDRL